MNRCTGPHGQTGAQEQLALGCCHDRRERLRDRIDNPRLPCNRLTAGRLTARPPLPVYAARRTSVGWLIERQVWLRAVQGNLSPHESRHSGFRAVPATPGRTGAEALPVGAVRLVVVVLVVAGEDEVPAVAAVLAAVGDDVAGEPDAVLRRVGEQVAAPTAVDAHDGGFRLQHARSLARMNVVTACG